MLRKFADKHGLSSEWQHGAQFRPPHAFQLPKNKMREEEGDQWRARIVFSYFHHPLKGYARCRLTLLIGKSKCYRSSLDMDRITGVVQWADPVSTHCGKLANTTQCSRPI